jgi:hypothetical protein
VTVLFKKWRLKSHDYGGYIVQKRIGKQWKETSYFRSLSHAVRFLLERRIHDESANLIVDTNNRAKAAVAKAKLIELINNVSDEIVEGLDER